jgi:hypothetical protein
MSLVEQFIDLFQGNVNAVGGEDGMCWRIGGEQRREQWEGHVRTHLDGSMEPIGVYPMVFHQRFYDAEAHMHGGWCVHWGCVDFDEGEDESWVHAKNLWTVLDMFGIRAWIERSRSKGYHVWVFAKEWTEAKLMREALLAGCQLVDAPTKEINPKQIELPPDSLGNYVRLPYPGWIVSATPTDTDMDRWRRRVMVVESNRDSIYTLEGFVIMASGRRVGRDTLESLRAHYEPPERPIVRRDWSESRLEGAAIDRLVGKARVIFEHGPLEGSGRGHTLYKLACYLREDGRHSRSEALELVRDADERWGKFHLRPDCDTRLNSVIEQAWAKGG